MKKHLLLVVALLLTTTLTIMGCSKSNNGLKQNPALTDAVINNGGVTVQKGDYLYFTNGFASSANLSAGKNNWGSTKFGAIYRTKLNNNALQSNKDGFLTNAELVVPKLVGYENGAFYIYGDNIYFSTPNNSKDKQGNSLTSLTDFYRVNINGSEKSLKLIHTSYTANLTPADWSIYANDEGTFLVVKDGANLVVANATQKNPKAKTVAKNVTSVAILKTDKFYQNKNATQNKYNNYVYYTRNVESSDNLPTTEGNILARIALNGGNEEQLYKLNDTTYSLKAIQSQAIYYTKNSVSNTNAVKDRLFVSSIGVNGELLNETRLTDTAYTNVFPLKNETSVNTKQVLVYADDLLQLITNGTPKTLLNQKITILNLYEDVLIYHDSTNSTLNMLNVRETNATPKTINLNSKTIKTDSQTLFDFDGKNIYAFVSYKNENGDTNYYLNKIDTSLASSTPEFLGDMQNGHKPAKPDNENKTEEEYVKWV